MVNYHSMDYNCIDFQASRYIQNDLNLECFTLKCHTHWFDWSKCLCFGYQCYCFHLGFIGHMLTSKYLLPFNKMANSFLLVYPIITRIIILNSDSSVHLSMGFIVRKFWQFFPKQHAIYTMFAFLRSEHTAHIHVLFVYFFLSFV